MMRHQPGYFRRLWAAILGQQAEMNAGQIVPAVVAQTPLPEELPMVAVEEPVPDEPPNSVDVLAMDLRERDARIAAMQREYDALQLELARTAQTAGREEIEALCKRLAAPLANLAALRALAAKGKTVEVTDVFSVISDIERTLGKVGLEQVGAVGEETVFDVATHQRMSGGDVQAGTAIVVRLPGYRLGERVVLKAMVSTKGVGDGASRD